MKKIAVLGSGSWGTAISVLLADKGHHITLWSYLEEECAELSKYFENKRFLPDVKIPDTVKFTTDLKEALYDKEMIVFAVPSFAIRATARNIKPFFDKENQIIINLAKGIDESTLSWLSETIKGELGNDIKFCALSGPSHAEEVGKKMPTTCVAASYDLEVAKVVQDTFMCSYFRVYTSTDVLGVEMGAAFKNIIALCAGISDGLGYGDNLKAAIMTRGMSEIVRLGIKIGGKPETFYGLTGIGDLIVTCTSMHSRNRRAGILIGQGKSVKEAAQEVKMVVEGIVTCKSAYLLAQKHNVEMPIVEEAYRVLYEGSDIKESMGNLMLRDKKHEH